MRNSSKFILAAIIIFAVWTLGLFLNPFGKFIWVWHVVLLISFLVNILVGIDKKLCEEMEKYDGCL